MKYILPVAFLLSGCTPVWEVTMLVDLTNDSGYDFTAAQACVINNVPDEFCSSIVPVADGETVSLVFEFVEVKNEIVDLYVDATDTDVDGYEVGPIEVVVDEKDIGYDITMTLADCCVDAIL